MTLIKSKIISTVFSVTALWFVALTCGMYVAANVEMKYAKAQSQAEAPIHADSTTEPKVEFSELSFP